MMLSIRRWRPRHLLASWVAYWIGLGIVLVSPALAVAWKVTRPGAHGSVNAGISDQGLYANITRAGQTVWTGSMGLSTFALWLALPPLALWILWMVMASRTNNAEGMRLTESETQRELISSEPVPPVTERATPSTIRRRREES